MKKVFVLTITVISLSLFMISCKDKEENDTTPPTISFTDNDILILDLGDKTAAMKGVIAKDDVDGDITSSITLLTDLAELETIGYITLKYSVSDAAKNTVTAERPAVVSSRKLTGRYEVTMLPEGLEIPLTPFIITVSELETVKLNITNFHGDFYKWAPIPVIPDPDRQSGKLIIDVEGNFNDSKEGVVYTEITGEVHYEKVNGEYLIVSLEYTLDPKDSGSKGSFSSTKCELIP
ncbi:MAG: hypothetical protein LBE13_02155 [Bacteroidales bacterium]|jgi:hypothetical protein|nr:hypothetical protein [Bacteroidales bacterium]